jgi:hypothetical protein
MLVKDLKLQYEPGPYYCVIAAFNYLLSGDLPRVAGEWPADTMPEGEEIVQMAPKRFLHAGFWE